ncbi:TIGR04388 family protein, partial [Leptospira stimsonii]|uniref:TIGR04388 family protein n=1 Tax=Leptospira stimsonii TaxID=2202203 RepID=UPI0019D608AA
MPVSDFSSVRAQSVPQLNSTRAFSNADLQPYVDTGKLQSDQSSFINIVNGGEQTVEAAWEAAVDAEINAIVNTVTSSDPVNDVSVYQQAVRAQLELQKQQAKSQWLADASAYIQTELQSFLNVLSQATSTNVTSSNTTAVNTVDPTVQSTTAAPASQQVSPAQAAQSYYQGTQAWDAKWQSLLAQQSAWEQNSLNSIQSGLDQWDNSILRAIQEKQDFLGALDQEEALWLNNGNLIQQADQNTRNYLVQIVDTIGATMQQSIGTDNAQNAALQNAYQQAQGLVAQVHSLLSANSPLDQIAQTLGNFFNQQKQLAQARSAYWDDPAQRVKNYTGYQNATFNYFVGSYSYSGVFNQVTQVDFGPTFWDPAIETQIPMNGSISQGVYFDSNGQLHSTNFSANNSTGTCDASSAIISSASSSSSTCNASTTVHIYNYGNCGIFQCDWPHSQWTNVTTNYSVDQNKLQQNQFLLGAINGTQFGDNNGVFGTILSTSNKVWLGGLTGSQITSLSQLGTSGAPVSLLVQTDYTFEDPNAIANRNLWSGLANQYDLLAQKLLGMVNPLQNWAQRNQEYQSEYSNKLTQLRALRASATQAFDDQISDLQLDRDTWLTAVYGHTMSGYGAVDNPDSQYRQGQQVWEDTILNFKNAELNWYLSSKNTLTNALQDPSTGELKFIADGSQQIDVLKNQITNSELNSSQLYDTANKLIDAYYYSGASASLNQAISNQNNEASLNQQGSDLSSRIRDSYARAEAYSTADLDASNRINSIVALLYGNSAYMFDSSQISQIQSNTAGYTSAQTFWQGEKDGSNGGFGFDVRSTSNASNQTQYAALLSDVDQAASLQQVVQDQEKKLLKDVSDIFALQEKYETLSKKFADEGKFDEAQYYKSLALGQASIAGKSLKSGYNKLSNVAETQVQTSSLTFTRNSYFAYSESLQIKGNFNAQQVAKEIRKGQDESYALAQSGIDYNSIQEMIGTSKQLLKDGEDQSEKVKGLIARSEELANRSIGGELLAGLNDVFGYLTSQLPDAITTAGISDVIAADSAKANEAESQIASLLQDMNHLLTTPDDLNRLADLRQSADAGVNLAANTAMIQYLDEKAEKMLATNKERSAKAADSVWQQLNDGPEYQYLRDQGYKFNKGNNGTIVGMRSINSGVYQVNGHAMNEGSYSAIFIDQFMNIQTQYSPPALSFTQLSADQLGTTSFNKELVSSYLSEIESQEKEMELAFEKFSDKTEFVKSISNSNEEERLANEDYYRISKQDALAQFNGLQPEFQKDQSINLKTGQREILEPKLISTKDLKMSGGVSAESKQMQLAASPKNNTGYQLQDGFDSTMFNFKEGLIDQDYTFTKDGEVYNGIQLLKGDVTVSGIPIEMTYGEERISVPTSFHLEKMGFDFNFNGAGVSYTDQRNQDVHNRYQAYLDETLKGIQDQLARNKADAEGKKLIFDVASGMVGGVSAQQSARNLIQSKVTGAVAEATGLPASFVGALVGGSSMKEAFKAFEKATITTGISKATGIPEWMISGQLAKMNKPKTEFYQTQEFQMLTTAVAVVAAPFTGGASLAVAMAIGAGIGAAQGAAGGGLQGALVGAVGGAAGAALKSFTGGAVNVNLSYSAENGFGASVGVGYGPATVSVGVSQHGG